MEAFDGARDFLQKLRRGRIVRPRARDLLGRLTRIGR
jgi:hypothetical protein